MKKIMLLTLAAVMASLLAACDADIDKVSADPTKTQARIDALETAINSRNYDGYMACFDDDASYQGSYSATNFNNDYPTGKTYTFGELTIDGVTVTCDSTKSTTASSVFKNTFTMAESGGDWYISVWVEDTATIFESRRFKAAAQR